MRIIFPRTNTFLLIFVLILPFGVLVKAQTIPTPFDLSTGSYQFTAWDSLSPAGSFPPNMAFHYVPALQTAPYYTNGTSDFNCSYKKSKRSRINGLMNKGIGIVTTSTSQYNDCNTGAADSRFMGVILLSLNATDRNTINVSWKGETITPGDGSPTEPRVWNLRLQYRLGESGLFTDVPGVADFVSSPATGDSVQFGPTTLPTECNNESVVQLRWIYFETSAGILGGSRPQLRLDDIEVSSLQTVGLSENRANKLLSIFPNPAHAKFTVITNASSKGTIQVTDQVGRLVKQETFSQVSPSFDCSTLPKGIYFVKVTDNSNGSIKTNKLLVQ
jgi:hypothetical protein